MLAGITDGHHATATATIAKGGWLDTLADIMDATQFHAYRLKSPAQSVLDTALLQRVQGATHVVDWASHADTATVVIRLRMLGPTVTAGTPTHPPKSLSCTL